MNSKGKRSVEKRTHTKARRGNGIVEKNRSRRGIEKSIDMSVEYSVNSE